MSLQDPIADMLTRIRNAQAMGITSVRMPFSNIKSQMLNVLFDEGYIISYSTIEFDGKKDLDVQLKYYQGRPVIDKIKRISKPALRVYKGVSDIPTVCGGYGIAILSTPLGVMSDKSARAKNVGGELLCIVE